MKKKKILFVIESLVAAGGEKSLVTLLSLLDYNRYDVDLQLFRYGGEFEQFLPEQVELLPPLSYSAYLLGQRKGTLRMKLSRLCYSISLRGGKKTIKEQARLYWKYISPCIEQVHYTYDVAIAYGQCHPTFYVAEKVNAKRKLAWVNCIYHLDGYEREYQNHFYQEMDKIVMVSEAAYEHFKGVYPKMISKMDLMLDIVNPFFITKMAKNDSYNDNFNGYRILTVARLNKIDKGYDITLEACRILKERNVNFRWYALGRGEYRIEMESYIRKHHLENVFIFLGVTSNPYPYIKDCTLYVQTSRHEGYGLSIAEARILNKPVVTTEYDSVWNQMVQGENGIVVPQDPISVADAVDRLLNDKKLYNHIVSYQQKEKKGNVDEIKKFYQLIED